MLTIQLLGGFKITHDSEPVPGLTKPRGKSLFAYLLLHHTTPQDRAHLAYTFWPETNDSQARTNLRRELHQLRQLSPLFDALILSNGTTVQWQMPADGILDVTAFARRLAAAEQATDQTVRKTHYQAAIDCYHGDLLPGLYEDWVLAKREELRQAFIRALETLTGLLVDDREYAAATTLTQRLLQYDPLYEAGYVQLMELYALQQDRAHALHTYHSCATILERELGVSPTAEIETLYQRLLHAEPQPTGARPTNPAIALKLVGRKSEWQTLLKVWRQAAQGRAQTVLIEGEAGIGKTRLAEELLEWANRQAITTARTRSYAAEGALAYAPVIEWLRSPALHKAISTLEPVWRTELARLLPELLTEFPALPHPEPLTERWQRQRLFEALARVMTVDEHPKLLLIDDLQWCDQETLEWLRYLLHFAPAAPLLLLGTVRVEEVDTDHPLHALLRELHVADQLTRIELQPLSTTETATLAVQVSDSPLDEPSMTQLMQRSEGNPLFVVEMVRSGFQGESREDETPLASLHSLAVVDALPPKVYAVIQHRLSQLSPAARSVVSLAATLGRAFTFDILVAASESNENEVVNGLDELWQRRVIREQGAGEYDFSHDRIREAAYAELSPIRRKQLHQRVAQVLEIANRNDPDPVSAQLAFHFERAGQLQQAIDWYQRAAQVAQRFFAHVESISYLESGLKMLERLQQDESYVTKKLHLLLLLDSAISFAYGINPPKRADVLREAQVLACQVQDIDNQSEIFKRLSFYYQVRGQHQEARTIVDEHLQLVRNSAHPLQQTDAYARSGVMHMSLANFDAAHQAMSVAYSILEQCQTPSKDSVLWKQYASHIDRFWCIIMWILGFPHRAQELAQRMLTFAPELGPSDRANIPFFAAILYRNLKQDRQLSILIDQLVTTGDQSSMWLSIQSGKVFRGWELAHQGKLIEGIALTQQGVDNFRQVGHTVFQTHRLAMLAEMHLIAHQLDDVQRVLNEAFSISEKNEEHFWDVELHRLRGNLLLAQDVPDEQAEAAYLRAIEVALQQGAKSLELRATIALCRLWYRQGQSRRAYQYLSTIYGWFTEGFDTHDLRVAQALLTELST